MAAMEVILRQDIKTLGKAGELVKVKPGYARNYLLPQGLAFEASEGNRKRIEAEGKSRAVRESQERSEAQALAGKLSGIAITLTRKAGEGDRLFGSITSQDIADALAAKGHVIDKRKIELEHPIKTIGEHTVPVQLFPDVTAALRITVAAE